MIKLPDPALVEIAAQFSYVADPEYTASDLPDIRAAEREARATLVGRRAGDVAVENISTPDLGMVRKATPRSLDRSHVILYVHGGGWAKGDTVTHGAIMTDLAALTGYEVLGPDYPLAPEHPYPQGLDAVMDLINDVHASRPSVKIILAGDSAGANMALGAALRLRDDGRGDVISAMLLYYGCYRELFDTPSHLSYGGGEHGLATVGMKRFWDWYLQGHEDPLYGDLTGAGMGSLPPAYLCEAELDCLASDTKWLAGLLADAGVPFTYDIFKDVNHGFIHYGQFYMPSFRAIENAAHFLKGLR